MTIQNTADTAGVKVNSEAPCSTKIKGEQRMAPSVHQYIRISGQAHERGVAYGSFAKERILKVIDEYKVLFDKEAHLPWKDAVRMAKRYEPAIRAYRPDLIDEMKGIAEGAGVPFDVILTLNCRSEVMFAKSEAPADDCSVIGVPPEASGNGKPISRRTGTGGRSEPEPR